MKITRVPTKRLTDADHAAFAVVNERLGNAQKAWNAACNARPFDKAKEIIAWNELQEAEKAFSKVI
jgi:hypothetical protein